MLRPIWFQVAVDCELQLFSLVARPVVHSQTMSEAHYPLSRLSNGLGPGLELLEVSWCLPWRPFPLHFSPRPEFLGSSPQASHRSPSAALTLCSFLFALCLLPLLPFLLPQGRQWSLGVKTAVLFGTRDRFCGRQFFPGPGVGNGFMMIQVRYIDCALYFYQYYISPTSDDQAFDSRGWGPLG